MLLQAYDFVRLHLDEGCDLQLGGSDQWGNISLGVEVVGKVTGDKVYGLTTPLVTRPDGTKYGKSVHGNVWLDPARTSPYRFYQFFLNTEDVKVGEYRSRPLRALFPRLRHRSPMGVEQGGAEVERVRRGFPDERERGRPARGQAPVSEFSSKVK